MSIAGMLLESPPDSLYGTADISAAMCGSTVEDAETSVELRSLSVDYIPVPNTEFGEDELCHLEKVKVVK